MQSVTDTTTLYILPINFPTSKVPHRKVAMILSVASRDIRAVAVALSDGKCKGPIQNPVASSMIRCRECLHVSLEKSSQCPKVDELRWPCRQMTLGLCGLGGLFKVFLPVIGGDSYNE